jgi:fluoroquinolone transport system permease protein
MNRLFKQIKWQFLIFRRNNLIAMIVGITAFYVLIIYLIRDFAGVEKFIMLLIYNDPALVGFIFTGISIILEKDQEVLPALFVTPLSRHIYLLARVVTLSLIGFFCALAMALTARGTSFDLLNFSVGAFSTCVLFSLMGIFIVSYTTEILHFLLRAVPLLILMSLPLLNYFELTDLSLLAVFPVQGGLNLMVNSFRPSPDFGEIVFGYLSIAVWLPVLYWTVYRIFMARIVKI